MNTIRVRGAPGGGAAAGASVAAGPIRQLGTASARPGSSIVFEEALGPRQLGGEAARWRVASRGSETGCSDVQLSVSNRSATGPRRPGSRGRAGRSGSAGNSSAIGTRPCAASTTTRRGLERRHGRPHSGDLVRCGEVGLAERHHVGRPDLGAEQRVLQPGRRRRRVHDAQDGFQRRFPPHHRVHEVADDVRRVGDPAGFHHDVVGRRVAPQQGGQRAQQVAFQTSTQMQPLARLTTPSLAPAINSASMLMAPEIVDHGGDAAPVRAGQQAVDHRRLARAQEPGDEQDGDRHGAQPVRTGRRTGRPGRAATSMIPVGDHRLRR